MGVIHFSTVKCMSFLPQKHAISERKPETLFSGRFTRFWRENVPENFADSDCLIPSIMYLLRSVCVEPAVSIDWFGG
jgi:hypothetical protein